MTAAIKGRQIAMTNIRLVYYIKIFRTYILFFFIYICAQLIRKINFEYKFV